MSKFVLDQKLWYFEMEDLFKWQLATRVFRSLQDPNNDTFMLDAHYSYSTRYGDKECFLDLISQKLNQVLFKENCWFGMKLRAILNQSKILIKLNLLLKTIWSQITKLSSIEFQQFKLKHSKVGLPS